MTTLAATRQELHRVHAERDKLRLRIRTGDLVPLHVARGVAFATARGFRDAVLQAPDRHASVIAAAFGLQPGALGLALRRMVATELALLAGRPPPVFRPPKPEYPPSDGSGFFESHIDNQWAREWREKNPERARQQLEYEQAIDVYNERWGLPPRVKFCPLINESAEE